MTYSVDNKTKRATYESVTFGPKLKGDGTLVALNESEAQEKYQVKLDGLERYKQFLKDEYKIKRQNEYPSLERLNVAQYDNADKAAIEIERAEVKAKYPKPTVEEISKIDALQLGETLNEDKG